MIEGRQGEQGISTGGCAVAAGIVFALAAGMPGAAQAVNFTGPTVVTVGNNRSRS